MKIISINELEKKAIRLLFIPMCLLVMSCSDVVSYDDDYTPAELAPNDGAPLIKGIYDIADTAYAVPLTEGSSSQMVCILGENLNNAKSITFNTVSADLDEVYTASTRAIVRIPSKLILGGDHQLVYTTDKGSAQIDFDIPLPGFSLEGLFNEFVPAGNEVSVIGQYFEMYGFGEEGSATITLNGDVIVPSNVTDETMKITIPAGTPDNSQLVFTWTNPDGRQESKTLPYRPSSCRLFQNLHDVQFDANGDLQSNPFITIEDDDELGTSYLHFQGMPTQWTWYQLDLSANSNDTGYDLSSVDDYFFVFEAKTANGSPYPTSFNEDQDGLLFTLNWGNRYEWDPSVENVFDTQDRWQTIRIPLSLVATNGMPAAGSWLIFDIVYKFIYADTSVDFSIGNFRIAKK
ncbi:MAG: hypothetical protein IJ196_02085 [Prevotella sp.]|nr:hypothetical protein [Prevotella sp.]